MEEDGDDEAARLNRAGTERANRPRKEVGIGISLEEEIGMLNANVTELQKAYMRMSAGPERDAMKHKLKELEDEVDVKINAVKAKLSDETAATEDASTADAEEASQDGDDEAALKAMVDVTREEALKLHHEIDELEDTTLTRTLNLNSITSSIGHSLTDTSKKSSLYP